MKVLIIIHDVVTPCIPGVVYDVLYKPETPDEEFDAETTMLEYTVDCEIAKEYMKKGWKYFISGDTAIDPFVLKEFGIKHEKDIEGLINHLKKRFPNAKVVDLCK